MITSININKLHPHSQNPRKQLGDLTELAESIKSTGILQNLTVVPIDPNDDDTDYTVVIGHRRLAASQLAGLTELPCAIADMDDKTQIATMLLENIQRSDLTLLEQAQGFQLMIDMGDTVGGIAEKTGFSNSTIRRRVKLMELDQGKLAQVADRNATLDDYEALGKIKDINIRNQVLEKIGTPDFKWKLQSAMKDEENAEKLAAILERVERFSVEINRSDLDKYEYFGAIRDADFDMPEDAGEQQYYFVKWQAYIALYTEKKTKGKPQKTQEEIEREEKKRQLKSSFRQAYEMRLAFAKDFKAKGKVADILNKKAVDLLFSNEAEIEKDVFRELFGIKEKFRYSWQNEEQGETYEQALASIMETYGQTHKTNLLFWSLYCSIEDPGFDCQSYSGLKYERNEKLEGLYEFLTQLGYAMSEEERTLLNGTHGLYDEAEEGE